MMSTEQSNAAFDPFAGPALAARTALTESQREIWLATQLHPEGAVAFNEGLALRLEGALDGEALRSALAELARRHDVLRASVSPNGAWLMVWDEVVPQLRLGEVGGGAAALAAAECEEMGEAFDLQRAPLIRFRLVRETERLHHLLMVFHHIAVDGWSSRLLLDELAEIYSARVEQRPHGLAPAPAFAGYAEAEREFLAGAEGQRHVQYWVRALENLPPAPHLPADHTQPRQRRYSAGRLDLPLAPQTLRALRQLGAGEGASLVAVALSLLAALYQRCAGAEDLVIAISAAGQGFHRMPGLAGHCVNLLPLRLRARASMSFRELFRQASETLLDGLDHQGATYGTVLSQLKLERETGAPPLIAAVLNVSAYEMELPFTGLAASRRVMVRQAAVFDWHFNLVDHPQAPQLQCTYNAEQFSEAMVRERLADIGALLAAAAAEPARALRELPLLDAPRREQVTRGWNDSGRDYPLQRPLHALVADCAAARPQAPAVVAEQGTLSYAELERRAEALAQAMRTRGVRPGSIVGVCSRRSLHLPVALLAVLKAGGAYLPLDPDYPQQRLALMLQDAECPVVLTGAALDGGSRAWLKDCGTPVLPIEGRHADAPRGAAAVQAGPEDPAYVIFTSGSTGRPKGAIIEHRGIVNRLLWMQEQYPIGPDDRILQKTPFSFDVSVWEFFWPLLTGATLVMAQPEGHKNPAYVAELIERERITVCHFVPSMMGLFLQQPELPPCRSLRHVFASGEALSYAVTELFRERLPGARLHNLYGPTEASVDVSWWPCLPDPQRQLVPIGRPTANTRLLVLDERLEPVPVGVPGELYLGGVQLARGYLKRPELTAERFIQHAEFGRLYRTGDLARWLPDGVVDYLGRLDGQVKLRGQRLELGEIEVRLDTLPEVAESACAVREYGPGDQRLIAWVVPAADAAIDVAEALEALRRDLPQYMIPQHLVQIAALPRLTSGKIDRKSLPEPRDVAARPRLRKPPVTAAEQGVAAIWRELLHVEVVNRDDRFFDLGGHSLLALRAVALLRQKFGVKPSLRAVMMGSVATLAAELQGADAAAPAPRTLQAVPPARMQEAFYFGQSPRRLFGTLGKPAAPRRDAAVLICQSWGIEYMRSHRALYLLAERLSDAGFHVMRFDYYGTGDSADSMAEAQLGHWLEDIRDAAQELRARSGLGRVHLLGHRLGALLAQAAQARFAPAQRLLLWDPPASGAEWLAQQRRLNLQSHQTWNAQRPRHTKLPEPPELELFGLPVSEAWRARIAELRPQSGPGVELALSADEALSGVVEAGAGESALLRLPDASHWNNLEWVTRPWNPRPSSAMVAAHLERPVS
jgi:amino acid adenylation domain-containing protein